VLSACEAPLTQILQNAGESIVWLHRVQETSGDFDGLDVVSMKICNLFEAGVVDPAKVVRCALTNAVSIASTTLTTECIVRKPEKALASVDPNQVTF